MKTYRKCFEIFTIGLVLFYLIFPLGCSTTKVKPNNVAVNDTVMVVDMVDTTTLEIKIDTIQFASFPYSISDSGKQFIKDHEKLRLKAYDDPSPTKQSIGWGHQIKKDEKYTEITKQKANEIFEDDIELVNASINRLLKKANPNFKYTQNFIDGLGSLIYNCGEYGVSTTDFYKRLLKCREDNSEDNINESDLNFTLAAVKTSKVFCKGHKIRRQNEYEMMIN